MTLPSRAVAWRFLVEIDGISVAEFSECSGLSFSRDATPLQEGGRADGAVPLPGRISQGNITLKRGLIDLQLLDWLQASADRTVRPPLRNVTLRLANESGEEVNSWQFQRVYPGKWTGPSLQADSNELALEELELVMGGGSGGGGAAGSASSGAAASTPQEPAEDTTAQATIDHLESMELGIIAEKVVEMLRRDVASDRQRHGLGHSGSGLWTP